MPSVTWTRETAAHLLRRAGFGSTKKELDDFEALGLNKAVDRLVDYESTSNAQLDQILGQYEFDFDNRRDLTAWWVIRMLNTARPLEEKMVFFWHDHFATSYTKVDPIFMKRQNDLFRTHALGNFETMLIEVSKDPAMLFWLDNVSNRVGKPNENYARELLELFSMGIGNYTETDIQEIARCFTGWTVRNEDFYFNAGTHDNGSKTFLGTTIPAGGGQTDGERVCEVVAANPATAIYMSRKLFEFFVYENPADAAVEPLASTFVSSGYSIREVMRQLFKSDEFYSDRAMGGIIKSPTEYVLGGLKSLDATPDYRLLGTDIGAQGQVLFNPPDVSGWDGGQAWINTTSLLQRVNFANSLATNRSNNRGHRIDIDKLTAGQNFTKAGQVVNFFLDLLGPITITKDQKKALKNYLRYDNNGIKQPFEWDNQMKDEKVRGLIHLIMALPEYHQN
jgi:uncharacterized protein (DUF1800 family)